MTPARPVGLALFLAVCSVSLFGTTTSCGGDAPVGADCAADADCGGGTLRCFCIRGQPDAGPNGYVPGVCSVLCSSQADCAKLGSDMSCAAGFCTGVNVCLQGYSGPTLP